MADNIWLHKLCTMGDSLSCRHETPREDSTRVPCLVSWWKPCTEEDQRRFNQVLAYPANEWINRTCKMHNGHRHNKKWPSQTQVSCHIIRPITHFTRNRVTLQTMYSKQLNLKESCCSVCSMLSSQVEQLKWWMCLRMSFFHFHNH